MTEHPGSPQPQDRLASEAHSPSPGGMPVIGENGIVPAQGQAAGTTTPATPAAAAPVPGLRVGTGTGPAVASTVAVFGDVHRTGAWTVASTSRAVSVFSDVILDLREAVLESREVTINSVVAFGDLKVVVPPGVRVEQGGLIVFGDQRLSTSGGAAPDAPVVRLNAYGAFGDLKVYTLEAGVPVPSWRDFFRRR